MFSAQNGIFLQIQKGGSFSILCVVSEKRTGREIATAFFRRKQIKSQYHKKAEILWHDKDFGFCCFLMKLSVIGEQKKR